VRHKLGVLRGHCSALRRNYEEIAKTIVYQGALLAKGDHHGFVEEMTTYSNMGVQEVFVIPVGPTPERWIRRHCGPVIRQLEALDPTRSAH
jgi:hypothetical protein